MRLLGVLFAIIIAMFVAKQYFWDDITGKNKDKTSLVSTAGAANPQGQSTRPQSNSLAVDIYVAERRESNDNIFTTGSIIPYEEVDVKSEISGRLTSLNIKEGGVIQKGQLIAKIDDRELQAQLKKLHYEEELANQIEVRQKRLLDINAISKEEYDMAVNKLNTLSADRDFLNAQLDKTNIRAPFTGRLGFKSISQGAYVTPGQSIVNLVQSNPIKIDFSVSEKYNSKISLSQKLNFTIDGSDKVFSATIIALDPKVDENLRTFRVRAQTSNADAALLPGMYVRIELPISQERIIMIPTESVIPILKGKKVYVMRDGKATDQEIKTGVRSDLYVEVSEGLNVGDSIIVSALMAIKHNTPVQTRNIVTP